MKSPRQPSVSGKAARVLGIMSGTSMDGVDYALCEVDLRRNARIQLLKHWHREFPAALRDRIRAAAADKCGAYELAQLHHDLGRLYARQASALPCRPSLVGLHGQTVFHNPDRRAPATLQIGEPAYLAEALRVPIVSNFRPGDMAAGGQGAPLATVFHQLVFAKRGRHVCINNLGGISNVTSLDWTGKTLAVKAFDTGPANVLIDLAVQQLSDGKLRFDRNGRWARRGRIDESLVLAWLKERFYTRRPPKSTGRELFSEEYLRNRLSEAEKNRLQPEDILASLTELTARSVALNYRLHLPRPVDEVVLAGGGADNSFLLQRIGHALETLGCATKLSISADHGWPSQAIEPAAFALLAAFRTAGIPANLPQTTGAVRPVVLGTVSLP